MKTLTLQSRINAPVSRVYPYFFEFEKFGSLHPLITKVTQTGANTFLINESLLLLGFIPMKPEYSAQVSEENGKVLYRSEVKKGVNLEIWFTFTEDKGETLITEEIKVEANPLVASMLLKTMKKAHSEIFERLKKTVNPQ